MRRGEMAQRRARLTAGGGRQGDDDGELRPRMSLGAAARCLADAEGKPVLSRSRIQQIEESALKKIAVGIDLMARELRVKPMYRRPGEVFCRRRLDVEVGRVE